MKYQIICKTLAFLLTILLFFSACIINKKKTFENKEIIKNDPVSIAITGDILLAKIIERKVSLYGHKYLFNDIKKEFEGADIVFANMEGPASFLGRPDEAKPADITFRANPAMLFSLKYAGFNVVSLGNNHSTDFGAPALSETMELLDLLNIKHIGAGKNLKNANNPAIIEIKGLKIAMLGFADKIWRVKIASDDSSGVSEINLNSISGEITNVKEVYKPDYLILSLHWGMELENNPTNSQITLAHDLINAGADLIIGHHPHVIQGVEFYKKKLIIYSMGNFLFDMKQEQAKESMIIKIYLNKKGIKEAGIIPVIIDSNKFKPEIADDVQAGKILKKLQNLSSGFNTEIDISGNYGIIRSR